MLLCVCMFWCFLSFLLFFCRPPSLTEIHERLIIGQGRQPSMRYQSACDVFCIFVLLANSVWSWELTNFHWVKSDKGKLVCGMSKPNKTLKDIGSRAQCMSACFNVCPSPCQAVNYWTNAKRCQHFYYIPCYYAVKEDCINYQVTTTLSTCGVYMLTALSFT